MGDRFYGSITIGGQLPRSLFEEFLSELRDSGAGPDSSGGFPRDIADETALLALLNSQRHLCLSDCEVPLGHFCGLEDWLEQHEIPFDAYGSSYCEFMGDNVVYRPGMKKRLTTCDTDGRDVVNLDTVFKARQALGAGNPYAAIAYLDDALGDYVEMSELPPFEIVAYPCSTEEKGGQRAKPKKGVRRR